MACARNTNIQNSEEYAKYILYKKNRKSNCRKYKSVYPSFTPTINSLSVSSSFVGSYSNVMINGTNFLRGLLEILYKSPKVASLLTTRLLS